jgi:hypothetical protein
VQAILEQINIANELLHKNASAATDDVEKSTIRPPATNEIPKPYGPAKKMQDILPGSAKSCSGKYRHVYLTA